MPKLCPYCEKLFIERGGRSNEHLFPAWLCERREGKVSLSVAFPGKEIPSDLTINDVCLYCNNGGLAKLDGCAKRALVPLLDSAPGEISLIADCRLLRPWRKHCGFELVQHDGAEVQLRILPVDRQTWLNMGVGKDAPE